MLPSISETFSVPIALSTDAETQLVLQIPAFIPEEKIIAPAYTKSVNVHIVAATYNITSFSMADSFQSAFSFGYNGNQIPAQSSITLYALPEQSITMVLLAMQYIAGGKGKEKIVQDLRWRPCGIVGGYIC